MAMKSSIKDSDNIIYIRKYTHANILCFFGSKKMQEIMFDI